VCTCENIQQCQHVNQHVVMSVHIYILYIIYIYIYGVIGGGWIWHKHCLVPNVSCTRGVILAQALFCSFLCVREDGGGEAGGLRCVCVFV